MEVSEVFVLEICFGLTGSDGPKNSLVTIALRENWVETAALCWENLDTLWWENLEIKRVRDWNWRQQRQRFALVLIVVYIC